MKKQIIEREQNGYKWLVDLNYIDNIETLEYYLKEINADFNFDEDENLFADISDVKKADKKAIKDDIIAQIDFTEDEYNVKSREGEGFATFDEFITSILNTMIEQKGSIADAVFVANDAYSLL